MVGRMARVNEWNEQAPADSDDHLGQEQQVLGDMPPRMDLVSGLGQPTPLPTGRAEEPVSFSLFEATMGDTVAEQQVDNLQVIRPPVGDSDDGVLLPPERRTAEKQFVCQHRWSSEIQAFKDMKSSPANDPTPPHSSGEDSLQSPSQVKENPPVISGTGTAAVITLGLMQILQDSGTGPELSVISKQAWLSYLHYMGSDSEPALQYDACCKEQRSQPGHMERVTTVPGVVRQIKVTGPFTVDVRLDGCPVWGPIYVTSDPAFTPKFIMSKGVWEPFRVKLVDWGRDQVPIDEASRLQTVEGLNTLIDSGAEPNLITRRAHSLLGSPALSPLPVGTKVRMADDTPMACYGYARKVPINAGGHQMFIDALLVESLGCEDDIILGRQFLRQYDVAIDLPNKRIDIRNAAQLYQVVKRVEQDTTAPHYEGVARPGQTVAPEDIEPIEYEVQRKRTKKASRLAPPSASWLGLVDHTQHSRMRARGLTPPSALVQVQDGTTWIPILSANDAASPDQPPMMLKPKDSVLTIMPVRVSYERVYDWQDCGHLTELVVQCSETESASVKNVAISHEHQVNAILLKERQEFSSEFRSDNTSELPVAVGEEEPTPFPRRPDLTKAREKLTPTELLQFENVLYENEDLFSRDKTDIGLTHMAEHKITLLPGAKPFREAPRRQNPAKATVARETVEDLLRLGMIEESASPFASGIVLVNKKDGTYRMCIDFRKLNGITKKDAYPLPRIDDMLEKLGGAKYFSSLDLTSGFWQVPLDEESREYTAFVTQNGFYQWRRMPFGLCNATASFQRLMNKALVSVSNRHGNLVLCYIDDVLIATSTVEEHLIRLQEVFQCLRNAGLKIKASKCQFFETEVRFLGRVISDGQCAPDPNKVKAISDWRQPTTKAHVASFLGTAGYYREFIQSYSAIAEPLTRILRQGAEFEWKLPQQEAFDTLKARLTSEPVLRLPTDDGEYILDTDASDVAVGAVLQQRQTINGEEKIVVISYGSKTMSPAQRRYAPARKEMLALLTFIEQYSCFLTGRQFTVRTDCAALIWLITYSWKHNALAARWTARMQNFDFEVIHQPREKNKAADGLSKRTNAYETVRQEEENELRVQHPFMGFLREASAEDARELIAELMRTAMEANGYIKKPTSKKQEGTTPPLDIQAPIGEEAPDGTVKVLRVRPSYDIEFLVREQLRDPVLGVYRQLRTGPSEEHQDLVAQLDRGAKLWFTHHATQLLVDDRSVLVKQVDPPGEATFRQVVAPRMLTIALIARAHDLWGHPGITRTINILQRTYDWPGMKEDVMRHIASCVQCQLAKPLPKKPRRPLKSIKSHEPNDLVQVDYLSLPGVDYAGVLVMEDHFTKYVIAMPVKRSSGENAAFELWDRWVRHVGFPKVLQSDQGPEFESKTFLELLRLMKVVRIHSTAYRPQTNGAVERVNRTLIGILRAVTGDNVQEWPKYLVSAEIAYNSSVHETTGQTPHKMMFGRERRTPLSLMFPEWHQRERLSYSQWARNNVLTLAQTHDAARRKMERTLKRQALVYDKRVADAPDFTVGQEVFAFLEKPRDQGRKLMHTYTGPHVVVQVLHEGRVYVLDDGRHINWEKLRKVNPDLGEAWLRQYGQQQGDWTRAPEEDTELPPIGGDVDIDPGDPAEDITRLQEPSFHRRPEGYNLRSSQASSQQDLPSQSSGDESDGENLSSLFRQESDESIPAQQATLPGPVPVLPDTPARESIPTPRALRPRSRQPSTSTPHIGIRAPPTPNVEGGGTLDHSPIPVRVDPPTPNVEEGEGREERTAEQPTTLGEHHGTTAMDADATQPPLTQQQREQVDALGPQPRVLIPPMLHKNRGRTTRARPEQGWVLCTEDEEPPATRPRSSTQRRYSEHSQGDVKPFTLQVQSLAVTFPDMWDIPGHADQLSLGDVPVETGELGSGTRLVNPESEEPLASQAAVELVANQDPPDAARKQVMEEAEAVRNDQRQDEAPPGPSTSQQVFPSCSDDGQSLSEGSDHPDSLDGASGGDSVKEGGVCGGARAKIGAVGKVKKLAGFLPAAKARASDAWSEVGLTVSSRRGGSKKKAPQEKRVYYFHSAFVTVVVGNVLKEEVLTFIDITRDVTVGSRGIRTDIFRVYPGLQQYVFLQKAQVGGQVCVPPQMVGGNFLCFVMVADTRKDTVSESVYLAALDAVAEQQRAAGGSEMAIVPPLVKDFAKHKRRWCEAVESVVRRAGIVARLYKTD
jgi:hypothetical protein